MGWFGAEFDSNDLAVTVGDWVIRVARASVNAEDPTAEPTYTKFADEPRLRLLSIFHGSSVAGPSYAKLKAATGEPVSDQIDVENTAVLLPGDRVLIGLRFEKEIYWMFGGYLVSAELGIEPDSESLIYTVAGPEWAWGTGSVRAGAAAVCSGQYRVLASADDAGEAVQPEDLWLLPDEACVFNPDYRPNMTATDVLLTATTPGRVWETPNRLTGSTPKAAYWDRLNATRTLVTLFNDTAATGIDSIDWEAVASLIGASDPIRNVNVDGQGLWGALAAVLGPRYAFYVDPRPADGQSFRGFALRVFDRTQGPPARLHLDPRGTPMSRATPCVARLQATKDISKTVNDVSVVGKAMRHVRLKYWGDTTGDITDDQKKTALQQGWAETEGSLTTFAGGSIINTATIDAKGAETAALWRDRYCTNGREFAAYRHVFRLFTWNEAAELIGPGPTYGTIVIDWYAPDLTGVADDTGFVAEPSGRYARRRRRILDAPYLDTTLDGFRKTRPALFMAIAGETEPGPEHYIKVPSQYWSLDPERGAIWITAEDLCKWKPFESRQRADKLELPDNRNFAQLLLDGDLRMILEGSIECDTALVSQQKRTTRSASPLIRKIVSRTDYAKVIEYTADGVASPMGLTPMEIDDSEAAAAAAENYRDTGQDEQIHASILVAADWERQPIGSMIGTIEGRDIRLASTAGRGAQIVAFLIDPEAMKYELLTESAAHELRRADRMRLVQKRNRP